MSRNLHQQLIQLRSRAKAWLEGGKPERFYPELGICCNLSLSPTSRDALSDMIARWPGGSGEEDFPVPHPSLSPYDALAKCGAQEMWDPEFEYARNRWALLEWLIEQTTPNN